jgi:hypothetical protein
LTKTLAYETIEQLAIFGLIFLALILSTAAYLEEELGSDWKKVLANSNAEIKKN